MDIQPSELKAKLDNKENVVLLDVRESWEFDLAKIPGSVLAAQELITEMIDRQQFDQPIVTICHHGVRSRSAAAWLRARGFKDVRSLTGGVELWAVQVDSSIGRY